MKLNDTLIRERIRELEEIVYQCSYAELEDDGSQIRISNSHGRPRYYYRANSKDRSGVYIKDGHEEEIQNIVQRNYDLDVLKKAKEELSYLRRFLAQYPKTVVEDVYPKLNPARQLLIVPAILTMEQFVEEWESVSWEPKGFRPDDESEYYNKLGVRMKSKQETILSNQFIDRDVPQRYEFPIRLKGIGKVHPDFMLLNKRTRKEYYWEHMGLWDDPWYRKRAIHKLIAYQRSGIYIGEQLILTFETSAYHTSMYDVDQLIDHYLM